MNAYGFDQDYGPYLGHPMDPRTDPDATSPEAVRELIAEVFLDQLDKGNPNELIPVDGPVKETTLANFLTWMSEDAAKLLLIATVHARRVHSLGCGLTDEERAFSEGMCERLAARALRAFAEKLAEEYAEDNEEAAA